ncbi:MAG: hypothetical protein ACRDS0_24025 [Pseudonocardiaceae bacterium]
MFQLIRTLSSLDLAARQAPVFALSFLIASFFYEFGNFALETGAFLVTWFVLDALVEGVRMVRARVGQPQSEQST